MHYIIAIAVLQGTCEQEGYLKPVNTSSVKTLLHVEKNPGNTIFHYGNVPIAVVTMHTGERQSQNNL